MDIIRDRVRILCKEVRKDAILITDSFNFSDFIINSPLGRYDGNIYEAYFAKVNESYPAGKIPPYFQSHVQFD